MSSYCSVRFNFHYNKLISEYLSGLTNSDAFESNMINSNANNDIECAYSDNTISKIKKSEAIFDARLMVFPEDKQSFEISNHMIWRSIYDCYRNGISTFADFTIGKKKTVGLKTKEKIEQMKTNHNLDFNVDVPHYYRHGAYCKKY